MLKADGFDKALLGTVSRAGYPDILCYDRDEIIKQIMSDHMTRDDAEEYFDFNIGGAHVGTATPCFLTMCSMDDVSDRVTGISEEMEKPMEKVTAEAVMNYLHHVEGTHGRKIDALVNTVGNLAKTVDELSKIVSNKAFELALGTPGKTRDTVIEYQEKGPIVRLAPPKPDPNAWRKTALAQFNDDIDRTGMTSDRFYAITGTDLKHAKAIFSGRPDKFGGRYYPRNLTKKAALHANHAFGYDETSLYTYTRFPQIGKQTGKKRKAR